MYDKNWRSTTTVEPLDARALLDGRALPAPDGGGGGGGEALVGVELEVAHSMYYRIFPTAPRDCCEVRGTAFDPATGVVYGAARSVRHARCPPRDDGHVRMDLHVGGFRLAPAPEADGGARATWMCDVTCTDPGGAIPKSVVSMTAADRAMNVRRVRLTPIVKDAARWGECPPELDAKR